MNTSKANTNKPWLSPEYDIPVLENEEIWSQQVIDDTAGYIWLKIDREENDKEKEAKQSNTG
jgi:hypothetical protein